METLPHELRHYDYALDPALIAQTPLPRRDQSRLMELRRESAETVHHRFDQLPSLLRAGDLLVLNDTRVRACRLRGAFEPLDSAVLKNVELFLLRPLARGHWEALIRPGKKAKVGRVVQVTPSLRARVMGREEECFELRFIDGEGEALGVSSVEEELRKRGETPLPPYIKKGLEDPERYQTVFARHTGSAAAPTAGLHFTGELMNNLKEGGIGVETLTLEIGLGTFQPMKVSDIREHPMHAEHYTISEDSAARLNRARSEGRRLIAVGTTALRALESNWMKGERFFGETAQTRLFLHPPQVVRSVEGLITNFHLPRSSLLALVMCFAGSEAIRRAYAEAQRERYRFFSLGDAMFIH